ncbi:GNAT family N-acetyltransferase [Paroceanicella profunda]|nr:GNAT family N-acetyltransferase [Paroceanicella profunda]
MDIRTDFTPGDLGAIIALHARYYARDWGFGTVFECNVALGLASFAARRGPSDLVLVARDGEGLGASLILDLNDPDSGERGAHLRWFITADRCRGTGLGGELMRRAMHHADTHAAGRAWLTTFEGLAPARHLYERHGFALARAQTGTGWGTEVVEQEFRRAGPSARDAHKKNPGTRWSRG